LSIQMPDLLATPLESPNPSTATNAIASDLEHTLESMTVHRSVLGYIVLSRATPASIIRHSGVVFEGEQGRKYAMVIKRMADMVQGGLEEVSGADLDELRFMRIRTKRHEILISPNERYILAVLHDPSA